MEAFRTSKILYFFPSWTLHSCSCYRRNGLLPVHFYSNMSQRTILKYTGGLNNFVQNKACTALINPHRMHCTRSPWWQVETWEIASFMLLVSTISNVQALFVQLEALINGIIEDKSMTMQVLIRHLEKCTLNGMWGPGIYLFINKLDSSRWIYEGLSTSVLFLFYNLRNNKKERKRKDWKRACSFFGAWRELKNVIWQKWDKLLSLQIWMTL